MEAQIQQFQQFAESTQQLIIETRLRQANHQKSIEELGIQQQRAIDAFGRKTDSQFEELIAMMSSMRSMIQGIQSSNSTGNHRQPTQTPTEAENQRQQTPIPITPQPNLGDKSILGSGTRPLMEDSRLVSKLEPQQEMNPEASEEWTNSGLNPSIGAISDCGVVISESIDCVGKPTDSDRDSERKNSRIRLSFKSENLQNRSSGGNSRADWRNKVKELEDSSTDSRESDDEVFSLGNTGNQLKTIDAHHLFDESPIIEVWWNQYSRANRDSGIGMKSSRQESGYGGTPMKDSHRKFSRMSSSWRSDFKGGTASFIWVQMKAKSGRIENERLLPSEARGESKILEFESEIVEDPKALPSNEVQKFANNHKGMDGFRKMAIELTSEGCENSNEEVKDSFQLDHENVGQSLHCHCEFKKGMYNSPKLDFHVRNAFDFSEKMSLGIEPNEKGEWFDMSLNQIGIVMSGCSLTSVSFMANSLLDEMSTGAYSSCPAKMFVQCSTMQCVEVIYKRDHVVSDLIAHFLCEYNLEGIAPLIVHVVEPSWTKQVMTVSEGDEAFRVMLLPREESQVGADMSGLGLLVEMLSSWDGNLIFDPGIQGISSSNCTALIPDNEIRKEMQVSGIVFDPGILKQDGYDIVFGGTWSRWERVETSSKLMVVVEIVWGKQVTTSYVGDFVEISAQISHEIDELNNASVLETNAWHVDINSVLVQPASSVAIIEHNFIMFPFDPGGRGHIYMKSTSTIYYRLGARLSLLLTGR